MTTPTVSTSPHIVTLTGPSGSGKTELIKRLTSKDDSGYGFRFVEMVSITTRPPRTGEVNGVDYVFTSIDDFKKMESEGLFLESVYFNGNHYGTLKSDVLNALNNGMWPTIICEPDGVKHFEDFCLENKVRLFSVFVDATLEVLIRRYLSRMGEKGLATPEALAYNAKRISKIFDEWEEWCELRSYNCMFTNSSDDIKDIQKIADDLNKLSQFIVGLNGRLCQLK